jgi:thioredoxin-like negative regulator of GroEL
MNAAVHVVCPHCGRTNRVPADRLAAVPSGIRGIPTLILFRGGREAARISGALDAWRLADWVRQQR